MSTYIATRPADYAKEAALLSGGAAVKKKKKTFAKSPKKLADAKPKKIREYKFADGIVRTIYRLEGKGTKLYTQYKGKWVSATRLKAALLKRKAKAEAAAKAKLRAAKAKKAKKAATKKKTTKKKTTAKKTTKKRRVRRGGGCGLCSSQLPSAPGA